MLDSCIKKRKASKSMWISDNLYIGWNVTLYEDSSCKLVVYSYSCGDTISVDRVYMTKEDGIVTLVHCELVANYPKDRATDEEFYNMYAEEIE